MPRGGCSRTGDARGCSRGEADAAAAAGSDRRACRRGHARGLSTFALSIDDFVVAQYMASGANTTTVPMRIYSTARAAPTPALNALATIMLVFSLLALALAWLVFRRRPESFVGALR